MILARARKGKRFKTIWGRIHPPSLYELWRGKEDTSLRRGYGAARETGDSSQNGKDRKTGKIESLKSLKPFKLFKEKKKGGKDGEPGKESRNTALELVEFG